MKNMFLGLGLILTVSSSFANECSINADNGRYYVYQGETYVMGFSSADDAIKHRDELVSAKACVTSAVIPDCSIQADNGTYSVYQHETYVMGFSGFSAESDAIALRNTLVKGKACTVEKPSLRCSIKANNGRYYVYQGETYVMGFSDIKDASELRKSLISGKACN